MKGSTATARREPICSTSSTLRTTLAVLVTVAPERSVAVIVIWLGPSTSGTMWLKIWGLPASVCRSVLVSSLILTPVTGVPDVTIQETESDSCWTSAGSASISMARAWVRRKDGTICRRHATGTISGSIRWPP